MRSIRMRSVSGGLICIATAAITTLVVVACATGTEGGIDVGEGGLVEEAAARDVNVVPLKDGGLEEDTGVAPEEDSGGGCTQKVVINELKTGGPGANDELAARPGQPPLASKLLCATACATSKFSIISCLCLIS